MSIFFNYWNSFQKEFGLFITIYRWIIIVKIKITSSIIELSVYSST
nr:MAG TPA: hypothetical protein [Crassvirales sp.]